MSILNEAVSIMAKTVLLALLAPLVSGLISKIKNILRMRRGPGILQPYYNVRKFFYKDEMISSHASWIFYAAPIVVFASAVTALSLLLTIGPGVSAEKGAAVLIAALFLLGLGRFFLALAGLDTGSSFGGMGSSREMFISSLAEPTAFIAVFVLYMGGGSYFTISALLAGSALFMVALAETSRIPVDNQETHLELTMVHEAMALEYSGRSLALIELAGHIKQMFFFILLSWYIFPFVRVPCCEWLIFAAKIGAIGFLVALIEISVAKMRLFRVVDFLSFSFFIALLASIAALMGL